MLSFSVIPTVAAMLTPNYTVSTTMVYNITQHARVRVLYVWLYDRDVPSCGVYDRALYSALSSDTAMRVS